MYFAHILLTILLVSVYGKEIGNKIDPEQTDDNQIEGTTTEDFDALINDYIEGVEGTTTEGNDYEDGSGDGSDDYIDDYYSEDDEDDEDDEVDNCLQPVPKDSKSRDANFWFFYNNETRRCELFRYGGEVTGETGIFLANS